MMINQKLILKISLIVLFVGICSCIFIQNRVNTLYRLTLSDPLFYTPQLDTDELRTVLSSLTQAEANTRKMIFAIAENNTGLDVDESRALKQASEEHILPLSFLKTLPDTIDATNAFFEKTTFINALKMNQRVSASAKMYEKDAKSFNRSVDDAITALGNRVFTLESIGSVVRPDVTLEDSEKIVQNSNTLLAESRKRSLCLLGWKCPKPTTYQPQYVPPPPSQSPDKTSSLTSNQHEDFDASGPYMIQSSCFEKKYNAMYLLSNQIYTIPKLVDESYYTDYKKILERAPSSTNALPYTQDGIPYHAIPEGVSYRCTDLSYWGDITTIDYLQKEYEINVLSSSYDLYTLSKDTNKSQDYTTILIAQNRLVMLPQLLKNINYSLSVFNTFDAYTSNISPIYLTMMRSAYSLTFGTFSRSIWRIDERPQYVSQANTPLPEVFTTHTDLKEKFTDQEIRKFHFSSKEILSNYQITQLLSVMHKFHLR